MPLPTSKQARRDQLAGTKPPKPHPDTVRNGEDDVRDIANQQCGLVKYYAQLPTSKRKAHLGKATEVSAEYAPPHAITSASDKLNQKLPYHPTKNPNGRRHWDEKAGKIPSVWA